MWLKISTSFYYINCLVTYKIAWITNKKRRRQADTSSYILSKEIEILLNNLKRAQFLFPSKDNSLLIAIIGDLSYELEC